ncbi:hypothetical protein B9Z55_004486 [Caenorhabditis nigoni]|uniref:C-type lectin domain-containing protein n=1 Tax=Caenorhabditis nigoni TaxID=1611254 RepID=A0A2G5UWM9_9PELO|nr:hypothetical protein B9Z55_004486 [Caenorhabditis nigoni]
MILLFLLPLVFLTGVSAVCPDKFLLFKRTPTAKNNFTKEYCLGFVPFFDMNIREDARSVCAFMESSLALPENQQELDALIRLKGENKSVAVDGEFSTRCKAKFYREDFGSGTNTVFEKGECNPKNDLFVFDDRNTDTTFFKNNFGHTGLVRSGYNGIEIGGTEVKLYRNPSCVMMGPDGRYEIEHCDLNPHDNKPDTIRTYVGALCGVHPRYPK